MDFNDIFGQTHIINSLKGNIENNTTGHAYIFEGAKGIGKKTVANIFANTLVCENELIKPCNTCKACLLSGANNHPDIKRISGENSIGVDTIREIVKDSIITPFYNKKKVYIIEEAEKMTTQAQNSLLKVLEEPPEYVIFVLTTEASHLLLPTILSRCVILKFKKNTDDEIQKYIRSKCPERLSDSKVISSLSQGVIGNVEKIINSSFNNLREAVYNILSKIVQGNKFEALETVSFFNENKDDIDLILHLMILWFRDIMITRETNDEGFLVNSDSASKIIGLSRSIGFEKLNNCIQAVLDTKNKLALNGNFQMNIEVLILKLNA